MQTVFLIQPTTFLFYDIFKVFFLELIAQKLLFKLISNFFIDAFYQSCSVQSKAVSYGFRNASFIFYLMICFIFRVYIVCKTLQIKLT